MRASTPEIDAAVERLADKPPIDVLTWAAERFAPRVVLATGFGAEGCVLVHLVARHQLPIEIFTLDTGLLFPETYALWQRLECHYGIRIRSVQTSLGLDDQQRRFGDRLWERDPRRCCALRKVEPLRAHLQGYDAWVTAIRRNQTAARAQARVIEWDAKFDLVKINPLVSWTPREVWRFISSEDVPYNPLHDRGYASIGCAPCTTEVADGEDPRAGRWRGRNQNECGLHTPGEPMILQVQRPS
jgi:phosphoadenosine phosphosulfate reductase